MQFMKAALLGLWLAGCASPSATRPMMITPVVENYVRERDFSGVTRITGSNGAVLYVDARGLADRDAGTQIAAGMRFQIASISKLFVAAAVLRQVDRGRITLEAPIGRYIPDLPPLLATISVSDLLQHTSGLRRESDFDALENLTIAEHVARLTDNEITSKPGRYAYSNTGYVLLARVVERVSREPFEDVLRIDVLARAHLKNTGFIVGRTFIPDLAVGYARSRSGWRVPPRARHLGVYPPGGLYSTAVDLATFMDSLANGRLLSPASTRALFESRIATGEGAQTASYAGVMTPRNGETYLLVAGSADGGKAVLMRAMGAGRTIVILSNVGDVPITEMLRDVVLASEGRAPAAPKSCRLANPSVYADLIGDYDFTGTGLDQENGMQKYVIGLVVDGDKAFLADQQDNSMTLLCEREPGVLTPAYTDDIRIGFQRSQQPTMVLVWDGKSYRAERTAR